MQQVHQHIQATLKDIYRKAIDADANLTALQQQNKGNFNAIFNADSGFKANSKRFLPYVEELTTEFETLQALNDDALKQRLPSFIAQLELILTTLVQFHSAKR